jgi:ABC-type bacteriocin/lantibiotic exporter with double-glycine peptidase domain
MYKEKIWNDFLLSDSKNCKTIAKAFDSENEISVPELHKKTKIKINSIRSVVKKMRDLRLVTIVRWEKDGCIVCAKFAKGNSPDAPRPSENSQKKPKPVKFTKSQVSNPWEGLMAMIPKRNEAEIRQANRYYFEYILRGSA